MGKKVRRSKYEAIAPLVITPAIEEFASDLDAQTPILIPRRPQPFAAAYQCVNNCMIGSDIGLGVPALGWSIWQTRNVWLTAELHCVLRNRDGYLDITPSIHDGPIMFAPTSVEIVNENMDEVASYLGSLGREQCGSYKLLAHHQFVVKAAEALKQASFDFHRSGNSDVKEYDRQMAKVEHLLDCYFARSKPSRKELRAKKKAERKCKSRNRV